MYEVCYVAEYRYFKVLYDTVTDIAWRRSAEIFIEDFATVWEFFCLCDAEAADVS